MASYGRPEEWGMLEATKIFLERQSQILMGNVLQEKYVPTHKQAQCQANFLQKKTVCRALSNAFEKSV
jgi:hypothetical protein